MDNLQIILILLLGSLAIGAILFFIAKLLFLRKKIKSSQSPKVTKGMLIQALLITVIMIVIYYLLISGHKWLALLFGFVMVSANTYGQYVVNKNKGR